MKPGRVSWGTGIGAALLIAALLGGCGGTFQTHSAEAVTAASPAVKVQYALDQVNAGIAAAAQTVLSQTKAGAITPSDEAKYAAQLDDLTGQVKVAESILATGDVSSADGKLKIVQAALNLLQSQLIAAAAKENK